MSRQSHSSSKPRRPAVRIRIEYQDWVRRRKAPRSLLSQTKEAWRSIRTSTSGLGTVAARLPDVEDECYSFLQVPCSLLNIAFDHTMIVFHPVRFTWPPLELSGEIFWNEAVRSGKRLNGHSSHPTPIVGNSGTLVSEHAGTVDSVSMASLLVCAHTVCGNTTVLVAL